MDFELKAQQTPQQRQSPKLALTQNFQQSLQVLAYAPDDLIAYVQERVLDNPLVDLKYQERLSTWGSLPEKGALRNASGEQAPPSYNVAKQLPSLHTYLSEQVHVHYRATRLRQLVMAVVDQLDANGYFACSLADFASAVASTEIEALDALTLVQQLEPAGVGARTLQECLLLQIERREDAPPVLYAVVEEAFEAFALREWSGIMETFGVSEAEMETMLAFVQHLEAHPGARYQQEPVVYIRPELRFTETENGWQMIYLQKGLQQIQIQTAVYEQLRKDASPEVVSYLEQQRKAVEQLRASLRLREATMVRIGEVLLSRQAPFFASRGQQIAPLLLRDVAELLDLHESTISRAIKDKQVETPFGTYPLKAFFAKGFATRTGDAAYSVREIQQKMATLIEQEDKQKPLSDEKLATILQQTENIQISRRTIAKYRSSLKISPSSVRKC